jgi:hypothetical protein
LPLRGVKVLWGRIPGAMRLANFVLPLRGERQESKSTSNKDYYGIRTIKQKPVLAFSTKMPVEPKI